MNKNILATGIIALFIISSISPMVFGNNNTYSEEDKLLDNLAFMCYNEYGSSKYGYMKERLLNDYPDSDIVESEGTITPVETESAIMSGGPMDSPWPMSCYDNHHTSQSPYSTADNPYDQIFRFYCGWVEGGPVIDENGIIYFGDFKPYLYALYPNGTLKWKYKFESWIWSIPAINEDGTIYIGSYDARFYAINPDGTKKWDFGAGGNVASSPAIDDDGTIYFGAMGPGNNGRVWALYPNGTAKWHYDTGYWIVSDPAIGDDGTIYIGSGDKYLYAMNPNGTLKWRYKTGDYVKGPVSIASDGTIYVGSYDDYLYAFYPNNGTMKWRCQVGWGTETNPSIATDGTIYIGSDKLYAINLDGTKKWSFNLGSERWIGQSSPAISYDGVIYIGTHIGEGAGGDIIAVNPDGTERWRKKIVNYWVDSSPCIGKDGTVYIGSVNAMGDGYLFAFNRAELEADADGPYYGLINESVQFNGSATGGYTPYTWHWDFGDTHSSDEQNPSHTYTSPDNYTITLTVTDDTGNISDDSTCAWIQDGNIPPNMPDIDGPASGTAGKSYPYTFTTTDPEGTIIWYYIDWDDGSNTGWIGPYISGETITKNHKWTNQGTYTIRCKAKDPYDDEGPYSELKVTMPRDKTISNSLLLSFLDRYPLLSRLLYLVK